jgi:hypothetical protein
VNYVLNQWDSSATCEYNKSRSYIYFWMKRFDGEIGSVASRSRWPKHHSMQHSSEEVTMSTRNNYMTMPDSILLRISDNSREDTTSA